MSFDISSLDKPENPVKVALERLAADGFGLDGFDAAGARDQYQRPLVKDPSDMDAKPKPMQRPSTRAKALDDASGLIRWKAAMAARGAALHPDRAAKLADVDMEDPDEKKWLYAEADRLAELAGSSEGADYGSLVHALCEAAVAGVGWRSYLAGLEGIEKVLIKAVEVTLAAIEAAGITVIESEVCCVNERQGTAGSTDGIGRICLGGKTISRIFDIKTTKPRSLPDSWLSFLVQCRLYSTSSALYDPVTHERRRFPPDFDPDAAWIVHVDWRRAHTTIYHLDLREVDEAIKLANEVAQWRAVAQDYVSVHEPSAEELIELMERSIEQVKAERQPEIVDCDVEVVDGELSVTPQDEAPATTMDSGTRGGEFAPYVTNSPEFAQVSEGGDAPHGATRATADTVEAAAEMIIAAFEGAEVVEVQPLPERVKIPPPVNTARNGGQEDILDHTRARVAELREAGFGDRLMQVWQEEGLPGIGPSHPPVPASVLQTIDAVLREIETDVGRWVDDNEVRVFRQYYAGLSDEQADELAAWMRAAGWNPAHRLTRLRADQVIAKMHEMVGP